MNVGDDVCLLPTKLAYDAQVKERNNGDKCQKPDEEIISLINLRISMIWNDFPVKDHVCKLHF